MCDGLTDGKDELVLVEGSAEKYRQNFRSGLWCVKCGFQFGEALFVVLGKLIEANV
jgi:hypothetical protein